MRVTTVEGEVKIVDSLVFVMKAIKDVLYGRVELDEEDIEQ